MSDELERARRDSTRLGLTRTPAGRDAMIKQADVLLRLGRAALDSRSFDASRAYVEEALDLVARVEQVDSLHPGMPALLLDAHEQLGAVALASGDRELAGEEMLRAVAYCAGAAIEQRSFVVAAPVLERGLHRLWLEDDTSLPRGRYLRAITDVRRRLDQLEMRISGVSSSPLALESGSDALPDHPFHRAFDDYIERVTADPTGTRHTGGEDTHPLAAAEEMFRAGRRDAAATEASGLLARWASSADETVAGGFLGAAARAMDIAVAGHRFDHAVEHGGALVDAMDRAMRSGASVPSLARARIRHAIAHARSESLIDAGTLQILERAAVDLDVALEEQAGDPELLHDAIAILSYLAFYRAAVAEDGRGGAVALEKLLGIGHRLIEEQPEDPRTPSAVTEVALTAARRTLGVTEVPLPTRRALYEAVIGALELRVARDESDVDALLEFLEFSALFIYAFGYERTDAPRLAALRERRDEYERRIMDLEPDAVWKRAQIAELRAISAAELGDQGKVSSAIAYATEAVDIAKLVLEQMPDSAVPHERLVRFCERQAGLHAKVHDHRSETAALVEAVDVCARRLALQPDEGAAYKDLAAAQERASIALTSSGEVDRGLEMIRAALVTHRSWSEADPTETAALVGILRILRELDDVASEEPGGAEAAMTERHAVLARLEELDPHDPRCAVIAFWIHADEISYRLSQGDQEGAAEAARLALERSREALHQGGRNAEQALGVRGSMMPMLVAGLSGTQDGDPAPPAGREAPMVPSQGAAPQNRAARRAASRTTKQSGSRTGRNVGRRGDGRPPLVRSPAGHQPAMPVPWSSPVPPEEVGRRTVLKPHNTGHPGMFFGVGVAGSGDLVAVGAPGDPSAEYLVQVDGDGEDRTRRNSGAVHLYRRSDSGWMREAYLKPGQPGDSLHFGWSVAVEGDRVAIGAPGAFFVPDGEPEPMIGERVKGTGGVWIFERRPEGWVHDVTMLPPLSSEASDYGHSVALAAGLLVVGDPGVGKVHLYERDEEEGDGRWILWQTVSDPEARQGATGFGHSLALDGDTLAVGDVGFANEEESGEAGAGAAWVFRQSAAGRWEAEAVLLGPTPWGSCGHGLSVDVRGDEVVVGAPKRNPLRSRFLAGDDTALEQDSRSATPQHGAVCLYRWDDSGWRGVATLEAPEPHGQFFGSAVRILPDGRLAVGAGLDAHGLDWSRTPTAVEHPPKFGAVHILGPSGTDGDDAWQVEEVLVSDPPGGGDEFGSRIALLEDGTLLVASPNESSSGRGVDPGVVDQDAFESGCVRIIAR
jgi:tetratricopeptide (TPR) repeat protein